MQNLAVPNQEELINEFLETTQRPQETLWCMFQLFLESNDYKLSPDPQQEVCNFKSIINLVTGLQLLSCRR